MKGLWIRAAVFVCLLVTPALHAAEPAMTPQFKALTEIDLRTAPAEQTRSAVAAFIASAQKDRGIPADEVFLARKIQASTYFYGGDANKALQLLDEVLADVAKSPSKDSAADMEIRGNRAALLGLMGRRAEALREMLAIREWFATHKGKNNEEYIATTAEVGALLYGSGEAVAAEQASAEAVELARANNLDGQAVIRYWINWATLLNNVGRPADGLRELQNVAKYSEEKLGAEHPFTVGAMRNLGVQLNNAGRYTEAEAILRRALELSRKVEGPTNPNHTYTLNSLGYALLGSRGPAAAIPYYQEALEHAKAYPDKATPHLFGEVGLNLAQTYESLGRDADALKLRRELLSQVTATLGDKHATFARASADVGASLLHAGDAKAALPYLSAAAVINERVQKPRGKLRIQNLILEGLAKVRNGDASGYQLAKDAVETAREAVMSDLTSPTETLRNAAQYSIAFSDFAELAFETNHPEDAFMALQLAQLGDLDSAGAAYMARASASDSGAGAQLRELQDRNNEISKLRTERAALVAGGKLDELQALDAKLAALSAEAAALTAQIHSKFPAYAQLIRPEPETLARLQSRLGSGESVLLVQPARNGTLAMLIDSQSAKSAISKSARGDVANWVNRIRRSVDVALESDNFAAPFDVDAAYRLHNAVLPASLDAAAARAKTLYVQAGGVLASVPFAALVTQKPTHTTVSGVALRNVPWLLKRQAVVTPATLFMLGTVPEPRRSVRFAGIGAPALQGKQAYDLALRGIMRSAGGVSDVSNLPPLPGADRELRNMSGAFGGKDALLLTGADATRGNLLKADLSHYDVLAFATHGLVSGELRGLTEPGLVMTPVAGDPASGVLTASDVASLKLDADWVILSACNTAAGEGAGAPMYSGLARAFVFAGARGLLLSQWPVRDDIAARLTLQSVKGTQNGRSRGDALRQSQLQLIADKSVSGGAHPAAWAPFVLIGD